MEKWRLDRFNSLLGQTLKAKEMEGEGGCDIQATCAPECSGQVTL
ncbi:MAG: hypothetical protein ACJAQ6_000800 [Arenicella sp.]|jgi:hypothetical protein